MIYELWFFFAIFHVVRQPSVLWHCWSDVTTVSGLCGLDNRGRLQPYKKQRPSEHAPGAGNGHWTVLCDCECVCLCGEGRLAVLRNKEEIASTRRQVYLTEEACAEKTRQTTDAQSGMCVCVCSTPHHYIAYSRFSFSSIQKIVNHVILEHFNERF